MHIIRDDIRGITSRLTILVVKDADVALSALFRLDDLTEPPTARASARWSASLGDQSSLNRWKTGVSAYKGNNHGTSITLMTKTNKLNGTPIFTKSPKV